MTLCFGYIDVGVQASIKISALGLTLYNINLEKIKKTHNKKFVDMYIYIYIYIYISRWDRVRLS